MAEERAEVIVIGAGVIGAAVARELSRYDRRVVVLERASDVCEGTSKANSGIVHAGYDAEPGTLKARFNVEGNRMMPALSRELDFPFRQNGSMVLAFEEAGLEALQMLMQRGERNGVEGLRILRQEEVRSMEPGVSGEVKAALYAPTGGIVCPFGLTIALAENACENGVEFRFSTCVKQIQRMEKEYRVLTDKGAFLAPVVINAAGVYADALHNMVSRHAFSITPRRGEYCLFDRTEGQMVSATLFQLPTRLGKGILVTPTVHGNLLAGPTAEDVEDREAVDTTAAGLEQVLKKGGKSVGGLPARSIITSFAGLRAHGNHTAENGVTDFLIGEPEDAPGFVDVAGIESPGLTSAPAIGVYVSELVNRILPAARKTNFRAVRKGIVSMREADEKKRCELIAANSAYANVICRCEQVTEGEILDAIHRPLGATTLDGIKRRTRAGMGRCQAGFCSPKTVEILARELSVDREEISKAGEGSRFLTGYNKGYHAADAPDPGREQG